MATVATEGDVPSPKEGEVAVRKGDSQSPDGVSQRKRWHMTAVVKERGKKGLYVPASLCCICPRHDGGKVCPKGKHSGHFELECRMKIDSAIAIALTT